MSRRDDKRDVIIIGSGLGGLVAGIFLSLRGHSVLLLKEKGYQHFYLTKGYRFSPFSSFSEKFLEGGVLEEVSQSLRLSLQVPKKKVGFQVLFPKARIDLFRDRSRFQREWKREFPEEVAEIEKFYDEMAGSQVLLRPFIGRWFPFEWVLERSLDGRLSQFSKPFKEFIRTQLISWGNCYRERIPLAWGSYILSRYVSDQALSCIDPDVLHANLLGRFSESGGRIEETQRVEELDKKWGKGFAARLEEGSVFRADCMILNTPLHGLHNLFRRKTKSLSKWGKRVKPRYLLFPFFLGIREKVVPVGMKDRSVSVLDLEKPHGEGNLLFLSLSPRGDETKAPEGKRALTVESPMPVEEVTEDSIAELRQGVMKHLDHIFPFLENHLEFMDSSWGRGQVAKWSYPCLGHEVTRNFNWRKGCVPSRISKDLYFIGRENAPYLGLEGEIRNGLKIGRLIAGEKLQKDSIYNGQ